jgi:ATP-dependent RNA helicase DeaD
MKFSALNLSKEILEALKDMNFNKMTPIQERAIPLLLAGKDLIGQADTGTGKTAAFAIPTIEALKTDTKEIQALVLCPTRELCCQVAEQFSQLMKHHKDFNCVPIYGGQKIEAQIKLIKDHPQIIVGTPGRVLDHMKRGSLRLRSVNTIVLDEADKMLEMGFRDDIESILKTIKDKKQMMLFSATMQADILHLAKKYQNKAQHINLKIDQKEELKIEQIYYTVDYDLKIEAIKRLLSFHRVRSALIFCNTRLQVDKVYDDLKKDGFSSAKLHGDLKQNMRDTVMRKFREGEVKILIATDIAGRGIDVDDIDTIFNYNLPRDSQDYVHRIGRTARAGKSGLAISLINTKELRDIKRIAERHKFDMKAKAIPTIETLGISSVVALQNILIDSTLSKKASKKHLKAIKELQEELKEDHAVVVNYLKNLTSKGNNIFGSSRLA